MFVDVNVHMCVYCGMGCIEKSKDKFVDFILPSHLNLCSETQTRISRLSSKCFDRLIPVTSPDTVFIQKRKFSFYLTLVYFPAFLLLCFF